MTNLEPKDLKMTQKSAIRMQIALLIFMMIQGVLFGAGIVFVLTWPPLSVESGFWISVVVASSFVLAAPIAWSLAPRLRARFWRHRMALRQPRRPGFDSSATVEFGAR